MAEAKKLRYVGPFAEVSVPALGKTVKRNHQVEVEDAAVAASLLEQADWAEVGAMKKEEAPAPVEKG